MLLTINFPDWDRDLFVYLNSKNHPWLDPIMVALSNYITWLGVLIIVLFIIIYKNRITGKVAALFLLLGIVLNSVINNLIKLAIMRPRPGNEELLKEIINQLETVGTSYSFFSAHSSNSICFALFTTLYFKNKVYGFIVFIWAFLVAYSRIYVGKHYPLDVVVGILFGLFTGWMTYQFYQKYVNRNQEEEKLYEE